MTRTLLHLLTLLLAGCAGSTKDSAPLAGGDDCLVLLSGTWTVTGAAWGMGDNPMDGELSMEAEICTFTLGAWDMTMDDLPSGGVVDGDQVQLDGLNSYWRSCTGTAVSESYVSGTCDDDGAAFAMAARGQ